MLTKRKKQIFEYIKKYIKQHDYSPSIPEMAKHFKLAISTIHQHIDELKRDGYLNKLDNQPRTIQISENKKSPDLVEIPLLGLIAAGQPIETYENKETITVPKSQIGTGEHYALKVQGDSMIDEGIFDGDTVIIKKQSISKNGDTVVALLNNDEVTLKKIYKEKDEFRLQPANPGLEPIFVKELIIQGKVISVLRNYEEKRNFEQEFNFIAFISEFKNLIYKTEKKIKNNFQENSDYKNWSQNEDNSAKEKFCLETTYALFNKLILFWVLKDKKLLNFGAIEKFKDLKQPEQKVRKIYPNVFESTVFDWYKPDDSLFNEIMNLFNKYDFSSIDRDVLGRLYEQFISSDYRKKLGQVYTPDYIVDIILDEIGYIDNIDDKKIIDPSCGSGTFLVKATKRLINQCKKRDLPNTKIVKKIENNIWGLDINPFACMLAKTNIFIQIVNLIEPGKRIKINIFQTDSLGKPNLLSGESETVLDIKNKSGIFKNGFDFIVGNPPYVRIQNLPESKKLYLQQNWQTASAGNIDLYIPFFELGISLLSKNGKLGYICSNSYFGSHAGYNLRELLSNNYLIKKIIDFNHLRIFAEVGVYTCISIIDKSKKNWFEYGYINNFDEIKNIKNKKFKKIKFIDLDNRKWNLVESEDFERIKMIEKIGRPLKDICRISSGIATLADKLFIFNEPMKNNTYFVINSERNEFKIEKDITKPILKASILKSEKDININKRYIIWPYKKEKDNKYKIIPEEELKKRYPKTYEYLLSVKPYLNKRDKGKLNPVAWYAFGRTQGLNSSFGKKILTSGLNLKPRFIICKDKNITFYSGYAIFYKGDLKILQKILNSEIMEFYINKTSKIYSGGYRSYSKTFIQNFSVPNFNQKELSFLKKENNAEKINRFLEKKYFKKKSHQKNLFRNF